MKVCSFFFFFSSRRRHTRWPRDWSSDVCSSDLDEMELRPHDVDGNHRHLRWEQHGDENDQECGLATPPAQLRERIGDRDARREEEERRKAAVDEGIQRVAPEGCLVEDIGEVLEAERMWPEIGRERLLVRHERGQNDEDERSEEDERGDDEEAVVGDRDE